MLTIVVLVAALAGCSEAQRPKVASGKGTVTIALTSPVEKKGTTGAKVVCARMGSTYNVLANNVTVEGVGVTFNVNTTKYTGPGDYTVATTLVLSNAGAAALKGGVPMPASLTDDGGTVTIENKGGISGTVSWRCP